MKLLVGLLLIVGITCAGVVFSSFHIQSNQIRNLNPSNQFLDSIKSTVDKKQQKVANVTISGIDFSLGLGPNKLPTKLQQANRDHPLWEGGRLSKTSRPCYKGSHLKGSWVFDSNLATVYNYDGLGSIPGCCGRAAKYIKNTTRTAHLYRWQPDSCDLIPFSEEDFCLGLNGKNIMFVGDSINELWHYSILHALGIRENLSDTEGIGKGKQRCPKHKICEKYYPKPLLLHHVTNHFLELVHVKRISRDWKDEINNFGIIILNSGTWMVNPVAIHHLKTIEVTDNMFAAYMRRTATFLRNNYNGVVIFRTNYPGHPNCHQYDGPLKEPLPRPYPKRWQKYNWESIFSRNAKATGIFKRSGAVILNVEPMTSLRPDGHVSVWHPKNYIWNGTSATKTTSEENTAVDCLHYCIPGPMDTWTVLLINLLNGNIS